MKVLPLVFHYDVLYTQYKHTRTIPDCYLEALASRERSAKTSQHRFHRVTVTLNCHANIKLRKKLLCYVPSRSCLQQLVCALHACDSCMCLPITHIMLPADFDEDNIIGILHAIHCTRRVRVITK